MAYAVSIDGVEFIQGTLLRPIQSGNTHNIHGIRVRRMSPESMTGIT
jgi:hypothetical protein